MNEINYRMVCYRIFTTVLAENYAILVRYLNMSKSIFQVFV